MRKAKKPRRQLYPSQQERQLAQVVLKIVKSITEDTKTFIFPMLPDLLRDAEVRSDDYADSITAVIGQIEGLNAQTLRNIGLLGVVNTLATNTSNFNRSQHNRVIKSVLGVDIFQAEPWLNAELKNMSEEATSYITKLSQDTITEIGRITRQGVTQGLRSSEIEKMLYSQFKLSRNRAKLIARDQIGKLNGALTRKRQTTLGIKEYIWKNMQDERVVGNPGGLYPRGNAVHGNHWDRENKTYSWDKPPHDGHPGQPIRCRCYASPKLPDELLNKYGLEN